MAESKEIGVISRIKTVSNRARYEYWRERGVAIGDAPVRYLTKQDLDDYTDEQIWRDAHPGQDPVHRIFAKDPCPKCQADFTGWCGDHVRYAGMADK